MNNDLQILRDWLLETKGQDVLSQYDSNFDAEFYDLQVKHDPEFKYTLINSFSWNNSKEGWDYWNGIHMDFKEFEII